MRGNRSFNKDNLVTEGPVAILATEADRGGLGALRVGYAHGCRSIVSIDHNVVDGLQLGRLRDGLQLASELLYLRVAAALLAHGVCVLGKGLVRQAIDVLLVLGELLGLLIADCLAGVLRHVVEVFLHIVDLMLTADQLLDGLLIGIISILAALNRLDVLRSRERILTIVQRVSQLIGALASTVLALCTRSGVLLFAVLILILFFFLVLILGLIGIFVLGFICRLILRRLGCRGGGRFLESSLSSEPHAANASGATSATAMRDFFAGVKKDKGKLLNQSCECEATPRAASYLSSQY